MLIETHRLNNEMRKLENSTAVNNHQACVQTTKQSNEHKDGLIRKLNQELKEERTKIKSYETLNVQSLRAGIQVKAFTEKAVIR